MTRIQKALLWGLAIFAVAVAGQLGLLDEDTAQTLLIVMPALAFIMISGRGCCPSARRV